MRRLAALVAVVAASLAVSATTVATPQSAAPACKASELRGQLLVQGATGSLLGVVAVTNAGTRNCSLLGQPTLRLQGPHPPYRVRSSSQFGSAAIARVSALRPNGRATAAIQWSNWCAKSRPTVIVVLPHQGGTLEFRPRSTPRCDARRQPSRFVLGRFFRA